MFIGLYKSTLTYNKTFNQDHNLTVTAVQGVQSSRSESTGAGVQDIPMKFHATIILVQQIPFLLFHHHW